MSQNVYHIIGLMSGTSLDGVDIVYTKLTRKDSNCWVYNLINFETIPFTNEMELELRNASTCSSSQLVDLDLRLGIYFGQITNDFIEKYNINKQKIDFVSSHGQTIFHQPKLGYTLQIGSGIALSLKTEMKVISSFRVKDVLLGGQGAPLVPIGDQLLFSNQAESFLNIGGFANISFTKDNKVIAFDICPGNIVLNKLVNQIGEKFDRNGDIARKGEINFFLLDLLNELSFYKEKYPKSLGTEWLETEFLPLIKEDKDLASNLRTLVEHEAIQIASILNKNDLKSVLITGGGAHNSFLIERIQSYFKGKIVIPPKEIIDYKEAIIFSLLGALFVEKTPNCLGSVTGASRDCVGGVLYLPD